jgi:hypothetical protein
MAANTATTDFSHITSMILAPRRTREIRSPNMTRRSRSQGLGVLERFVYECEVRRHLLKSPLSIAAQVAFAKAPIFK